MRKCTVSLWLYEALEWTNEVKREAEQTMDRKRTDEIENEHEDLGLRAFRVATTICHHFLSSLLASVCMHILTYFIFIYFNREIK